MTTLAGPAIPEDIAAFIATLPTGILVNGHWQDGATGRTFALQDPADGTILTHVAEGDVTAR
jgi:succinate-semialdehyde dehydrogenase/glutarate-semialdehyde dehydrogenase